MVSDRRFFRPRIDDRHEDWCRIVDYELSGVDITCLWRGTQVDPHAIGAIKLCIGRGRETDFVPNPVSLLICSDRLARGLSDVAGPDFQELPAPIVDAKTRTRVEGYKLANVVRCVSCLDLSKSKVSHRSCETGEIDAVYRPVLRSSLVPQDVQAFRVSEFLPIVVFSEVIVSELYSSGLKGIAFEELERSY